MTKGKGREGEDTTTTAVDVPESQSSGLIATASVVQRDFPRYRWAGSDSAYSGLVAHGCLPC